MSSDHCPGNGIRAQDYRPESLPVSVVEGQSNLPISQMPTDRFVICTKDVKFVCVKDNNVPGQYLGGLNIGNDLFQTFPLFIVEAYA